MSKKLLITTMAALNYRIVRAKLLDEAGTCAHHSTGEFRWREVTSASIRNKEGAVRGAALVARNITERKKHEEERKALNDELTRRVKLRTKELQENQSHLRFRDQEDFQASPKIQW